MHRVLLYFQVCLFVWFFIYFIFLSVVAWCSQLLYRTSVIEYIYQTYITSDVVVVLVVVLLLLIIDNVIMAIIIIIIGNILTSPSLLLSMVLLLLQLLLLMFILSLFYVIGVVMMNYSPEPPSQAPDISVGGWVVEEGVRCGRGKVELIDDREAWELVYTE